MSPHKSITIKLNWHVVVAIEYAIKLPSVVEIHTMDMTPQEMQSLREAIPRSPRDGEYTIHLTSEQRCTLRTLALYASSGFLGDQVDEFDQAMDHVNELLA